MHRHEKTPEASVPWSGNSRAGKLGLVVVRCRFQCAHIPGKGSRGFLRALNGGIKSDRGLGEVFTS